MGAGLLTVIVSSMVFEIPVRDGQIQYFPSWLKPAQAYQYYLAFAEQLNWRQDNLTMYGKQVAVPRLQAWYSHLAYQYSGLYLPAQQPPELLHTVLTQVSAQCQQPFNAILANWYRTGADKVGWHADDEAELGENPVIASLSLGAERIFKLKHQETGEQQQITLKSGDFIERVKLYCIFLQLLV